MTIVLHRKPAMIERARLVWSPCGRVSPFAREEDRPRAPEGVPGSAKLTPYIYGARHCGSCHDQKTNGKMSQNEINGLICRMIEFPIYETPGSAHAGL